MATPTGLPSTSSDMLVASRSRPGALCSKPIYPIRLTSTPAKIIPKNLAEPTPSKAAPRTCWTDNPARRATAKTTTAPALIHHGSCPKGPPSLVVCLVLSSASITLYTAMANVNISPRRKTDQTTWHQVHLLTRTGSVDDVHPHKLSFSLTGAKPNMRRNASLKYFSCKSAKQSVLLHIRRNGRTQITELGTVAAMI